MGFNIKIVFGVWAICTLAACHNPVADNNEAQDTTAHTHQHADSTAIPQMAMDSANSDYQTVYLAIADTGSQYYLLQTAMYGLHAASGLPIDTLNRYYNPTKKEIVVAENDEDEMYRGEYFPRRFPGINLSIEHMNTYNSNSRANILALVAAICETKTAADSVLERISPSAKKAFVVKGAVFVGCMH